MKNAVIILLIGLLAGMVFAQGDPHYMWGYVVNDGGGYPSASCLTFEAFLAGHTDTIRYPDDPLATYNESNGGWSVQIGGWFPATGDTFVIVFEDTCLHTQGYDTAIVNMDSVSQGMGVTILSVSANVERTKRPAVLDITVSPTPFNSSCEIVVEGEGEVSVAAYNCLGNRVADIYSGQVQGRVSLTWKPDGIPAGVYFIKARTSNATAVQKAVFLP